MGVYGGCICEVCVSVPSCVCVLMCLMRGCECVSEVVSISGTLSGKHL